MYYRYIIAITLGVFCGTLIAFTSDFSSEIFLVSLFLFFINLLIFKFKNNSYSLVDREGFIVLLMFFFTVSSGILLGQISLEKDALQREKFSGYILKEKAFIGDIYEVKQKTNSQEILLNTSSETKNDFNIKVITNNIPIYNLGETISVSGKVATSSIILPSLQTNNKSINMQYFNSLNKIDGEIAFPQINKISQLENNVFDEYLIKIKRSKRQFSSTLEKTTSIRGAALGSGTLTGDASLFNKEEINDFRISGLSHILVVSGFNVTIIIMVFIYLFSFLNIRLGFRILILILLIILFMAFIGFGSSVLRAGFMSIALLISHIYGRGHAAKQTLFLVSLVMIIVNPRISAYDISFHLSFLATFGILFVFPILRSLLKKSLDKFEEKDLDKEKNKNLFSKKIIYYIYEIFLITLSIQIVTLPYLGFTFGYFSIFGILANIFVLPILPIIMLLGFLTFLFSFSFWLSSFFGFILSFFSEYIFFIAEIFSRFSFSKLETNFSFLFLIQYYFFLILFLIFEIKRKEIKKYLDK